MNVILQRHGARHIYVIPEGLRELMMDISREVLRMQPEQIYSFIADYLDALMITRENARIASSVVESLADCSITIVDLLRRTGMTREEADQKATIIQRRFRAFLNLKHYPKQSDEGAENHMLEEILRELELPRYQAEKAVDVIKAAWRSYKERQQIFADDMEFVNWRKALQNAMFLYRRTGIPEETARRAASKIKAAYRGYYTRRYLKGIKRNQEIGEQVATHGVGNYSPELQRALDKFHLDPANKKDMDAIIKCQYIIRRHLGRQGSKRLAYDILHNLANKLEPPSHKGKSLTEISSTGTKSFLTSAGSPLKEGVITPASSLAYHLDATASDKIILSSNTNDTRSSSQRNEAFESNSEGIFESSETGSA